MANSTIAEKIAQAESERQRIAANIAAAYDEAEAKGAKMPATENSANLADTVASIPEAVQPTLIAKHITENGTYAAEDDNADGYSEVTVAVPSGGEYIHTRDIVLDEDVAEIAIEFSENTIAAYLDVDISIANSSGKTTEYIYPRFSVTTSMFTRTVGMIWKNPYTVFTAINNVTFFSVCANTTTTPNSVTIASSDIVTNRKVTVRLYYEDSVFVSGGTIKIYECFGKGGT